MTIRKRYTSEEKVGILREHLEKNVSVPDVCEKYRIHPNMLYKWKKELFEKAAELFSKKNESQEIKRSLNLKQDSKTGTRSLPNFLRKTSS